MKGLIPVILGALLAIFTAQESVAQLKSSAVNWGEITGTVYGAAIHCGVDEKMQKRFLDAASAKIALNAKSQTDRQDAAREFIKFKRLNQREPPRGCLDIRQDFKELVRKLKTTSYGWEWREIADQRMKRRKWKP